MMNACAYLDQVVNETLRFYPIATRLERVCTKDCIMDGMEFKKGDLICFPIYAVHHSLEYYPDPEVFDPDRFSPEKKSKIPQGAFLPFGIGPRNCIGMRFALEEGKLALCHLIHSFRILKCAETPVPLKFTPGVLMLMPDRTSPIRVKLESRI
ncbi:unnamed protein product [Darwinula stevensoni]|uniref:Cytochrome P450 n=1 Tax=Darwinula stevensoni TaxID=69355 RepID=A0A7R9AH68_9CRUS|nr:unnamed protein product [Darwinula stevensoni]CAG0904895.1 unnamed protein product [Darwinula stevensoni]